MEVSPPFRAVLAAGTTTCGSTKVKGAEKASQNDCSDSYNRHESKIVTQFLGRGSLLDGKFSEEIRVPNRYSLLDSDTSQSFVVLSNGYPTY